MARARLIKPGFFANELLAECEPLARILFAGLWCLADRDGRLEDRPKKIWSQTLAYDKCDPDALLQQLAERGFIIRYEVEGRRYIAIPNFTDHQNPHPKEPSCGYPCPETGVVTTKVKGNRRIYFIQAKQGGPIKIGVANDPECRLNALQTGSAKQLRILGVMAVGDWTESRLHERFAGCNVAGEWFQASAELLAFIKENAQPLVNNVDTDSTQSYTAENVRTTADCALPSFPSSNPSLLTPLTPQGGEGGEGEAHSIPTPSEFVAAWNAVPNFVGCKGLTGKRLRCFQARARDREWSNSWREALARAAKLPFCCGRNDRGWRATVDWFLRPDTVLRLLEGFYDFGANGGGPMAKPTLTPEQRKEAAAKLKAEREAEKAKAGVSPGLKDAVFGVGAMPKEKR